MGKQESDGTTAESSAWSGQHLKPGLTGTSMSSALPANLHGDLAATVHTCGVPPKSVTLIKPEHHPFTWECSDSNLNKEAMQTSLQGELHCSHTATQSTAESLENGTWHHQPSSVEHRYQCCTLTWVESVENIENA